MNHTGAHKINNVLGQILFAKRMGAKRIIAETGAGQHGVATATVCAMFGMECTIYMGAEDTKRQALNVFRMELLGAKVVAVERGQARLKEAVDVAFEDLLKTTKIRFIYRISGGSSSISIDGEALPINHFKRVKRAALSEGSKLPTAVLACVGGGSNAIGSFAEYIDDQEVRLIGIEPDKAATMAHGTPGNLHGFRCIVLTKGRSFNGEERQIMQPDGPRMAFRYGVRKSG